MDLTQFVSKFERLQGGTPNWRHQGNSRKDAVKGRRPFSPGKTLLKGAVPFPLLKAVALGAAGSVAYDLALFIFDIVTEATKYYLQRVEPNIALTRDSWESETKEFHSMLSELLEPELELLKKFQ